jgi:hypothetical protein
MAYQALLTAKSDYSNFGSMLASAQENVADTNAQNTETTQFYDSYKAQLEGTGLMEGLPAVPLGVENAYSIGKKLYGAYQKSIYLFPPPSPKMSRPITLIPQPKNKVST